MYGDVALTLGGKPERSGPTCQHYHASFGTSYSEPHTQDSREFADMRVYSCRDGNDAELSFAEDESRYAYQATDASDQQDCLETAQNDTSAEVTGSLPLSDITVGQQFCVVSLYDDGEPDVDLLTVQEVVPVEGTVTFSITGWGDNL